MKSHRLVTSLLIGAAIGGAACSDDDEAKSSGTEISQAAGGDGAKAGRGSPSGASGGAGGRSSSNASGKVDSAAGGAKASAGAGGAAARGVSNATEPSAAGGKRGASDADAGVDGPSYPAVKKVQDLVLTQANDLRGLAFSASGKIWASGHSDADPMNRKVVLARFLADGTPDTSFDGDGFLVHDIVPGDEQSLGLVELPDGDVVVQANVSDGRGGAPIPDMAGGPDGVRANGSNVKLLRFKSSGELVPSSGDNGVAAVQFGWTSDDAASWPAPTYNSMAAAENMRYSGPGYPSDQAWGVLLDQSGSEPKLVVAGFGPALKGSGEQRYDNDRYVVRVSASTGAVDPTFNAGKPYTFNTQGTLSDGARRGLIESDGSIVSSGYTNFGMALGNHVVLLRLKPDGTPDNGFGFGPVDLPGVAVFNPFVDDGGVSECYAVARQASGRYITTGYGRATAANMTSKLGYATTDGVDLVSFAVKADGTAVDTGWGQQGTRAIQSEQSGLAATEDRGRDLVVLEDGRSVQVGRFGTSPAIFVLTPEGELDHGSGDKGVISYKPFDAMPSHFFAAALSKDGKRLVATTNNHKDGVLLAVLEIAD